MYLHYDQVLEYVPLINMDTLNVSVESTPLSKNGI